MEHKEADTCADCRTNVLKTPSVQNRLHQLQGVHQAEFQSHLSSGDNDESVSLIHPLLIDHIAKKVFSYIGWSYQNPDLLSCRLVCKTWCHTITNVMKRSRKSRTFTFEDGSSLKKFLNAMSNTTNLPFDDFSFTLHFFVKSNSEIFIDFLNLCGNYITNLSLTFGKHYSINLIETFGALHKCLNLINLKTFSLKCSELETMVDCVLLSTLCTWVPQDSRNQSEGLYLLMKAILSSAGTLENVTLIMPLRYFEGDNAAEANIKIGNLLATSLPDTVLNLELSMDLNDQTLSGISRLNLESLSVEIYGNNISERVMSDFLRYQAPTLQSLRILDFENIYCNQSLSFQEFYKVKQLHIKNSSNSLRYLRNFPNLEHLVLMDGGRASSDNNSSSEDSKSHSKVKSVEFQYPLISLDFIELCFNKIPNLTKLKLQITPESSKVAEKVFVLGTRLKELTLSFPEPFRKQAIDPIITGFPLGLCNRLMEEEGLNEQDPVPVPSRPCLTNLKRLEKLIIESDFHATYLTEVSVRYALMRMPWLEEVVLIGGHKISTKWLNSLKAAKRVTEINGNMLLFLGDSASWSLVPV